MPAQALLFALVGHVTFIGLIASLYRPAWFRINGRMPSRWKIGGIWLALTVLCVLMAFQGRFRSSDSVEQVPFSATTPSDTVTIDIALPAEASFASDTSMDAARLADEPIDAVAEVADAEPVAPMARPMEPARVAVRPRPASAPSAHRTRNPAQQR